MSIPTQTYEALYQQYFSAMAWMGGLGVKLSPGRTTNYERFIRHWKDAYRTATPEEAKIAFPDFVSSMFEILDFVNIHKAFLDTPVDQLSGIIQKLQKGVNGPINASNENSDSTVARNFLFEAAVAAKTHRPSTGIETIFDAKSDTGIRFDRKKIWVECKRVTVANKIEDNVRKASKQLEVVLKNKIGTGHRGIVAIDISKILNAGDLIFVANDDDVLLTSVDRIMDAFLRENDHIWQRVYERRHHKIIGTLVRFSFMATSEKRNLLVHASQWALSPRTGISASDEEMQRKLVALIQSAP
jgi:hypothetical protein